MQTLHVTILLLQDHTSDVLPRTNDAWRVRAREKLISNELASNDLSWGQFQWKLLSTRVVQLENGQQEMAEMSEIKWVWRGPRAGKSASRGTEETKS